MPETENTVPAEPATTPQATAAKRILAALDSAAPSEERPALSERLAAELLAELEELRIDSILWSITTNVARECQIQVGTPMQETLHDDQGLIYLSLANTLQKLAIDLAAAAGAEVGRED